MDIPMSIEDADLLPFRHNVVLAPITLLTVRGLQSAVRRWVHGYQGCLVIVIRCIGHVDSVGPTRMPVRGRGGGSAVTGGCWRCHVKHDRVVTSHGGAALVTQIKPRYLRTKAVHRTDCWRDWYFINRHVVDTLDGHALGVNFNLAVCSRDEGDMDFVTVCGADRDRHIDNDGIGWGRVGGGLDNRIESCI